MSSDRMLTFLFLKKNEYFESKESDDKLVKKFTG